MLSIPRVIAPVDFSECSRGAARYAGRLACHFQSELTLLHVLEPCAEELGDAASELSQWWQGRVETRLTNFLPDEFTTMNVRRVMLSGKPADEIVKFIQSGSEGLMVISTYGYGLFRRFLLGLVADSILRHSDYPVFTCVHTPDPYREEFGGFRNILCAVDFCPQSAKALEWASQFADEFHAELTIAHITPSSQGRVGEYFNPEAHGRWAMETRQEEFVMRAHEKLEAMQKSAGANATVFIDSSNDIPQAICSAASERETDLIVLGRGSSDGIERLRTKVHSIVRQSPCPVVSV
jgi:nucleotide-binding universal stress UspA family protein